MISSVKGKKNIRSLCLGACFLGKIFFHKFLAQSFPLFFCEPPQSRENGEETNDERKRLQTSCILSPTVCFSGL